MKNFLPKILIFICAVLISAFTSLICYKLTYEKLTADIDKKGTQLIHNYAASVSSKTDAYALTKAGLRQLDTGLPELALISLNQATKVRSDYRDGWMGLGLAQFQAGDYNSAIDSLNKAEKIDPINPKIYQLLEASYIKSEQNDLALIAKTKAKFLSK